MGEPFSGEENSVTKENRFTKFLSSPARTDSSKKSSSNPLKKLLLRRRSKRRGEGDDDGETSFGAKSVDSEVIDEEEEIPTLTEDVKQVVDTAIDHVFHPNKHDNNNNTSSYQTIDDGTKSVETNDNSSSDPKESKVDKFKEQVGKAEEDFKKVYSKAEEEWDTLVHKDPKEASTVITQRVEEEVVGFDTKTDSKEGTSSSSCCQGEDCIKEKKEEENCVTSLALWLQKLCAPWSVKKED